MWAVQEDKFIKEIIPIPFGWILLILFGFGIGCFALAYYHSEKHP